VLFYFANTATLPLVGEILTQGKQGRRSAWEVAAAVLVAEALMVVAPIGCGKLADKWGRERRGASTCYKARCSPALGLEESLAIACLDG
jgi:hypothetical protein